MPETNEFALQVRNESPDLARGVPKAVFDLYDVITDELLTNNLRSILIFFLIKL